MHPKTSFCLWKGALVRLLALAANLLQMAIHAPRAPPDCMYVRFRYRCQTTRLAV